ncbi:hypothetical protein B0H10DRAFT_1967551 [Mycena sp. CBHHK59/15]|nr:hypothetical protein B0H10DRAFT_1967927 [Mycena sp. CBHHK59/15]KAJ6556714.1 hypothetical protein B0H10DRAFT_1967551 [Mycena sp. CBHHK59/15]
MQHLFMSELVDENSDLWEFLANLPGLNLQTGPDGRVVDRDPKHLFKRICTLLRSSNGMVIGDCIVNRVMLTQHLLQIDGMTLEAINNLIDPSDHQNVPKAVQLLEAIIRVCSLPTEDFDQTMRKGKKAIGLLAHILHSILSPFVDVKLSLSEQVTRLAKYAHLILYADSQTMVMNVVFCVAKQKLLDRSQKCGSKFHLCQCGDDRLEVSFSDARCQTHSRNHDSLELADKLSVTADIQEIMIKYPEWRARADVDEEAEGTAECVGAARNCERDAG